MNYSNSIEGYCASPLSADELRKMRYVIDTKKDKNARFFKRAICSAVILGVAAMSAGAYFDCLNAYWICFGGLYVSGCLIFGTALAEDLAPEKSVSVKIHGVEMASKKRSLESVDTPFPENLGSPLAIKLAQSIQNADRKMTGFEKDLINRLNSI